MQIPTSKENLDRYASELDLIKFRVTLRVDPTHQYVYLTIPRDTTMAVFRKATSNLLKLKENDTIFYSQTGDEITCYGSVEDLYDRYGDALWVAEVISGVCYAAE
ncbi:hypothetical protein SS50377_23058 [Spironucleus salmonicida]|uniref:Ubiquitin-like domain-containing protein n=1 Tax=Spironucleus salmonicida TaxID=348837 RepID=V6LSP3_9EUKA|nr:hypothetical protein SS50377_23058 [Spironucleus salmonicida]|eukprot:EST47635.1 hypothetical protein SS50377_12329 [Spironucleus salmonicida]